MAKKNIAKIKIPHIIAIVIVLVVAVVVLALVFSGNEKKEEEKAEPEGETLAIAEEIHGFSAEIKEINDKTLTLEGWIPLADIEKGLIKETVRAVVTDNTKIVKLKFPTDIPKDSDEPVYPEETKMSFDELKVEDQIDIATIDNISENIKNKTEFIINDIFIVVK